MFPGWELKLLKMHAVDDIRWVGSSYKLETYNTKAYQKKYEDKLSEDWYTSYD
jgi:hypothetical protein